MKCFESIKMFGSLPLLAVVSILLTKTESVSDLWSDIKLTSNQFTSSDECIQRIYKECNYPTTFTDEELENVRQFLNYSFIVLADIKPDKPLCPKLNVRHDWKCLSEKQKKRVTNVWKQMYELGIIQSLTDIHIHWWPAWHKTAEFLPSHRFFINEFEKAMRAIDPDTTLPYWNPYLYGSQPERSSVWQTLGHSGDYSNGFKVSDGIYAEWRLSPAVRRHWDENNTINTWFTPEFITSLIQTSQTYSDISSGTLGLHFPPHINIGGYEGQYSVREASYDCLFFMHHSSDVDLAFLRWQLQKRQFLTPLSYNSEDNHKFNKYNGNIESANILSDRLTGAPLVSIKELFWVGFGDLCSIPDQLIRPINNLWKGLKDDMPTAAKRLPKWILEKYFPYFNSGNFSGLSHILEEVGHCNNVCNSLPIPTFIRQTEAGRRMFEAYRYDNDYDLTLLIEKIEQKFYEMWFDLNHSGYCSPYVTSY